MSRTNKSARLKAAVAATAAASMILTGSTFALWQSGATTPGAVITSGKMRFVASQAKWYDASSDRTDAIAPTGVSGLSGHRIDPATWRIVPKDTVVGVFNLDGALKGDNLVGRVEVLLPDNTPLSSVVGENGYSVSYAYADRAGLILDPNTGKPFTNQANETNWSATPSRMLFTSQDNQKNDPWLPTMDAEVNEDSPDDEYKLAVKVVFNADGTNAQLTSQKLSGLKVRMIQVRTDKPTPEIDAEGKAGFGEIDPCSVTFSEACALEPLTIEPSVRIVDTNGDGVANSGETVEITYAMKSNVDYEITHAQAVESTLLGDPLTIPNISIKPRSVTYRKYSYVVTDADATRGYLESNVKPSMTRPGLWNGLTKTTRLNVFNPTELPLALTETRFSTDSGAKNKINIGDVVNYKFRVGPYAKSTSSATNILLHTPWGDQIPVSSPTRLTSTTVSASHKFTLADIEGMTRWSGVFRLSAEAKLANGSTGTVEFPGLKVLTPVETLVTNASFAQSYRIVTDLAPMGVLSRGDVVKMTYEMENTGTQAMSNVSLSTSPDLTSSAPAVASLGGGAKKQWEITRTIGQDEVSSGVLAQDAAAIYTPTFCGIGETSCAEASYDFTPYSIPVSEAATPADASFTGTVEISNDLSPRGAANVGDEVKYTYILRNTGATSIKAGATIVSSTGETVTADKDLEHRDVRVMSVTRTLTAGDINAGMFSHSAVATFVPTFCDGAANESCATVTKDASLALTNVPLSSGLEVTASESISTDYADQGKLNVGDTWKVTYQVKNTGNTALVNGRVASADASWISGDDYVIDPGMTRSYTFYRKVTKSDIANGSANANAVFSFSPGNCGADTCDTVYGAASALSRDAVAPSGDFEASFGAWSLKTDVDSDGRLDAGDVISLPYTYRNTSNFVQSGSPTFEGALIGSAAKSNFDGPVIPGGTAEGSFDYTVTSQDSEAGFYIPRAEITLKNSIATEGDVVKQISGNSITVDAPSSGDGGGNGTGGGSTPIGTMTAKTSGTMTVDRSGSGQSDNAVAPGDEVSYKYTIGKLPANSSVSNVLLTDAFGNVYTPELSATESTVITFVKRFEADELSGKTLVTNQFTLTATVDGEPFSVTSNASEFPVSTLTSQASVTTSMIAKNNVAPTSKLNAGEVAEYTIKIANTGTIPISTQEVTATVGSVAVDAKTLYAGETQTWKINHVMTIDEVSSGADFVQKVTVKYAPTFGNTDSVSVERTVSMPTEPYSMTADLTANSTIFPDALPSGSVNAQDKVNVSLQIRNTGNVAFSSWSIKGIEDTSIAASGNELSTGSSTSIINKTYTPTAAEIEAGIWSREFEFTYTPVTCAESIAGGTCEPIVTRKVITQETVNVSADILLTQQATIVNDVAPIGALNVGETISVTYTIENKGTVSLRNLSVSSNNSWGTGLVTYIAPQSSANVTKTYMIEPGDVEGATTFFNTATVKAIPDVCSQNVSPCPAIYSNNSETSYPLAPFSFDPGLEFTFDRLELVENDVTKDGIAQATEKINYFWKVKNNSNWSHRPTNGTTYRVVTSSSGEVRSATENAPGGESTVVSTHTVTANEANSKAVITNEATLTFVPNFCETGSPCADVTKTATATNVTADKAPDVTTFEFIVTPTIIKDNYPVGVLNPNDQIKYAVTMRNTSAYSWAYSSGVFTLGDGSDAVTRTATNMGVFDQFYKTHTITAAEAATGRFGGFTATGKVTPKTCPTGSPCDPITMTVETPSWTTVSEAASMEVAATSSWDGTSRLIAGNSITMTYVVKNTGTVSLTGVKATDHLGAQVGAISSLAPSATSTYTKTYKVTAEDAAAGALRIAANGSASYDSSPVVSDTWEMIAPISPLNVEVDVISNSVTLSTDANGDGIAQPGDVLKRVVTIKNTSDYQLNTTSDPAVKLVSDHLPALSYSGLYSLPPAGAKVLNPGETLTTTSYTTVTPSIAGNVGTKFDSTSFSYVTPYCIGASSCYATGDAATSDTAVTYAPGVDDLSITSKITLSTDNAPVGEADAGETAIVTYTVKNTGTRTLSNLQKYNLASNLVAGFSGVSMGSFTSVTSLAPGETISFTRTKVLGAADVQSGSITDNATFSYESTNCVSCEPVSFNVTSNTIKSNPASTSLDMSVVRTIVDTNLDGIAQAGDSILYTYNIQNTGSSSLTTNAVQTSVTTPGIGTTKQSMSGWGAPSVLSPGASFQFTRTVAMTEALWRSSMQPIAGDSVVAVTPTYCYPQTSPCANVVSTTFISTPTGPSSTSATVTPAATLSTDLNGDGIAQQGDTLRVTYSVKNTSTYTWPSTQPIKISTGSLFGVNVTANAFGGSIAPGTTRSYSVSKAVTDSMVGSGTISVNGTAITTPPDLFCSTSVTPCPDVTLSDVSASHPASLPVTRLSVTATPVILTDQNTIGVLETGDTFRFNYTVTNAGSAQTTFKSMTSSVTNGEAAISGAYAPGTGSTYNSGILSVKSSDVDAGMITNTITYSHTPMYCYPQTSPCPTVQGQETFVVPVSYPSVTSYVPDKTSSVALVTNSTGTSNSTGYAVEMWVDNKNAIGTGTKLMTIQGSTAESNTMSGILYVDTEGRYRFGYYSGTWKTIQSSVMANTGPHHVVASFTQDGVTLYVDGQLVGEDATVTKASSTTNYILYGGATKHKGVPMMVASGGTTNNTFTGTVHAANGIRSSVSAAWVAQRYAAGNPRP